MADDDQTPAAGPAGTAVPGVDGERGISSITDAKRAGITEKKKKYLVAAGLVFLGTLAVLQWPSDEDPEPAQEEQREATQIRPARDFDPADLSETDEPEQIKDDEAPEKREEEPLGPIERVRRDEQQAPEELSEAEQLYESSKRAPVMAYQGNRTGLADQGGAQTGAAEAEFFAGGSAGAGVQTTGLAAQLVTSDRPSQKARVLKHPNLTLTQGTSMPCALDTAMDSTAPGIVRCTLTDDIYATTGAVILLERGTRIVGEYQGGMQRGRKRLFVIWTRAQTPTGVIVNLGSPGADPLGRTGLTGDVDTQFWTRFGGTMMLSIIDDALVVAARSGSDDEGTGENTRVAAQGLAQTELENTIDVPVILRKNQGEEVSVLLARDLDFSGVYRLK
ncbi:hypothetical protein P775_20150 [Puniceibacterium antarcticum]|uniref:Type IV secretion system protein VirB10 n=1 Tax=Puniceibacterium antarcticum TaxID=1206336 RepID=A0A2G8RA94_9RHOB|nr:type IV secretion system protein VirB10 [Puniceibacterium antarcticum]PIL18361.1 hypothetical protein P775_20150 [Puniceibacterium antarcticum]